MIEKYTKIILGNLKINSAANSKERMTSGVGFVSSWYLSSLRNSDKIKSSLMPISLTQVTSKSVSQISKRRYRMQYR